MSISRREVIAGAVGATVGAGALSMLGLANRAASVDAAASRLSLRIEGDFRVLESNGLPGHAIGDFPNRHDPVAVRPQSHKLRMPAKPIQNEKPLPINMWWFGVAVNGVPFDPSGPFWNSDASAGWQFEVLHPANSIALGIDRNNAHTQGGGMYHYHGMPSGLLASLMSLDPSRRMMLVGYAADGFPIYGPESPESPDDLKSPIRRLRSSYRLLDIKRANGPLGKPDGRFCEDHIYEPGFGDLDECNGRFGCTPEFPNGTYYYVITDSFPFIPRLYRGQPDASFTHGPPPGVSPPNPPELRAYRGV
jgi:YHYH protein